MRILVVCAAFLGGCSLLVPLDAVSGGADPDASTGAQDSAADGPPLLADGAPSIDANKGDAGNALHCPAGAIICDDFERDDAEGTFWQNNDGIVLSTTNSFSPTRSLMPKVGVNDGRAPWLDKVFEGDSLPLHIRVSFRIYAGKAPSSFREIFKIPYGAAYQWDTVTYGLQPDGFGQGIQRYDGNPGPSGGNSNTVVETARFYGTGWHHIVGEIDLRNGQKLMSTSFDEGAPDPMLFGGHDPSTGPAVVTVGISYRADDEALDDFFIDDLVIEPL